MHNTSYTILIHGPVYGVRTQWMQKQPNQQTYEVCVRPKIVLPNAKF